MQSFHPDIDPQTIRLMDELGFVSRSLYHMGEQSVDEAGLSFAQYRVLMHLFFADQMGDRGELNPSEISERQGVSRNTMSTFIRSLEEAGLIERRLDPNDRRRFNIRLTENGRFLVSQHTGNPKITGTLKITTVPLRFESLFSPFFLCQPTHPQPFRNH